jgi:hypothetical protein
MFGIYWWTLILKRKYEKLFLFALESNPSGWVIILHRPSILPDLAVSRPWQLSMILTLLVADVYLDKMDMGEEKELGLMEPWGFQELYVCVGDFLILLFIVNMCPCGLVWNECSYLFNKILGCNFNLRRLGRTRKVESDISLSTVCSGGPLNKFCLNKAWFCGNFS